MSENPIRIGVIRNPQSQRNRKNPRGYAAAAVTTPANIQLAIVEPASPQDLPQVLVGFAQSRINHVVVDGGDGTLRDVLSLLPAIYGAKLPKITVFAGGNANLAAADIGVKGHGARALQQLLTALARTDGGRYERRHMLMAHWPDGSHAPVMGFFAGTAGFYRGWKMAMGPVSRRGLLHGPAVAVTMLGALWQTVAGSHGNVWKSGAPMVIGIDDGAPGEGARFLFLATSLHRMYGSLWPFFDHGDAVLRWLDIDAHAPRLGRALLSLLRGRPLPWLRASGAYRSGGAQQRITLRLTEPLVVDGEAYAPGADGLIELRPGPEFEFYLPLKI
ncbi:MAG: hypothetical protein M0P19_07090 [Nevskia sp.]|jgi:hypothetical protein|nr:hypothetical protein [Nevskia sp.]MCK9385143.1 hypothetical protein [Nevskia sp.]